MKELVKNCHILNPWNENEVCIKFAINGGAKKVPNRRLPSGTSKPNMQRKRKGNEKVTRVRVKVTRNPSLYNNNNNNNNNNNITL